MGKQLINALDTTRHTKNMDFDELEKANTR